MMQFANLDTQTEGPLPRQYGSTHAGSWENDPDLHIRNGWREITDREQPPEGHTATRWAYVQDPDNPPSCYARILEQEPESAEFQRTVDDAETEVRMLAEQLAKIGLTIPCGGKAGAIRHIRNLPPGTLPAGALGDLDALYQAALAVCGSDEMLTLIWEAIKQADAE